MKFLCSTWSLNSILFHENTLNKHDLVRIMIGTKTKIYEYLKSVAKQKRSFVHLSVSVFDTSLTGKD